VTVISKFNYFVDGGSEKKCKYLDRLTTTPRGMILTKAAKPYNYTRNNYQ